MNIIRGVERPFKNSTVATIGSFDGIHLGHQKIIKATIAAARAAAKESVLITFAQHPRSVLAPNKSPQALTTTATKIKLLRRYDLDNLLLLDFTPELAATRPQEFCDRILADVVKVSLLYVGTNFRFGAKAAGNIAFLEHYGRQGNFQVEPVPLEQVNGREVSSTLIRSLLISGEVDKIPAFLGRHHFLTGEVITGSGRGEKIGFPTANLQLDPGLCLPREGVYAGYFWRRAEPLPAAINVGGNPTFGPGEVHIEAHILNFSENIYGEKVRIELHKHLRSEIRFPSVAALKKQITADVERTRRLLTQSPPTGRL